MVNVVDLPLSFLVIFPGALFKNDIRSADKQPLCNFFAICILIEVLVQLPCKDHRGKCVIKLFEWIAGRRAAVRLKVHQNGASRATRRRNPAQCILFAFWKCQICILTEFFRSDMSLASRVSRINLSIDIFSCYAKNKRTRRPCIFSDLQKKKKHEVLE